MVSFSTRLTAVASGIVVVAVRGASYIANDCVDLDLLPAPMVANDDVTLTSSSYICPAVRF